jgi:hypothetical protein
MPNAAYADAFVNMMQVPFNSSIALLPCQLHLTRMFLLQVKGWKHVVALIASDDLKVTPEVMDIAFTKAMANMKQEMEATWEVKMLDPDELRISGDASTESQSDAVGATAYGNQMFLTIQLLARCDGFVGTLSSGFSRVALLLGVGAYDIVAYHSLDIFHNTKGTD